MFRPVALLLALAAVAYGRMAYQFSDQAESFLRSSLKTTFTCDDLPYGYYADMDNNCEVFHVCLPIADDIGALVETAHFSFICGNATVFSQESLTCVHQGDEFPCDQARTLYELSNSEFGLVDDDTKK